MFSRQFSERDDAWHKRAHDFQSEIHEKNKQITTLTVEYHFPIYGLLLISNPYTDKASRGPNRNNEIEGKL